MNIIIRRVEDGDSAGVAEIYTFETVLAQTSQFPHRGLKFWQDFYSSKSPEIIELVAIVEEKVVGHLGILLNNNPRRKHVCSFGIAIHPDYQAKGIGKAMVKELIHLADNWLNLLKIELDVFTDNEIAIGLYKKLGFIIEGETRYTTFKNGAFGHTYKMARFNPNQSQLYSP